MGRLVMGRLVMGCLVMGRLVMGRFVCESSCDSPQYDTVERLTQCSLILRGDFYETFD